MVVWKITAIFLMIPSDLKERACEQTKGYEMSIKICLLPQIAIVVVIQPMVVHGYKAISENPLRESCL